MKKVSLAILLCFILVLVSVPAYAEINVTEAPNVKVVIDGKAGTYSDVPIIVNGRTLLPLRALLNNLGVENDSILWNASERSVTATKGSTKIYLQIDNATAYANDVPQQIDVAPVIYKNRTYIPARFVCEKLGKKVVWDGSSKSVLIRDLQGFNQIKELLEKSNKAMDAFTKYKMDMKMKMAMTVNGMDIDTSVLAKAAYDREKKLMYMNMEIPLMGQVINTETYMANNAAYTRSAMSGDQWVRMEMSSEEFDKAFQENSSSSDIEATEAVCAGLVASEEDGKFVLEGDIYLGELYDKLNTDRQNAEMDLDKCYLKIILDKETFVTEKIYMDFDAKMATAAGESKLNAKVDCAVSDLNGDFEIVLPYDIQ